MSAEGLSIRTPKPLDAAGINTGQVPFGCENRKRVTSRALHALAMDEHHLTDRFTKHS